MHMKREHGSRNHEPRRFPPELFEAILFGMTLVFVLAFAGFLCFLAAHRTAGGTGTVLFVFCGFLVLAVLLAARQIPLIVRNSRAAVPVRALVIALTLFLIVWWLSAAWKQAAAAGRSEEGQDPISFADRMSLRKDFAVYEPMPFADIRPDCSGLSAE